MTCNQLLEHVEYIFPWPVLSILHISHISTSGGLCLRLCFYCSLILVTQILQDYISGTTAKSCLYWDLWIYRVRRIMHGLEWRTVYALTPRVLPMFISQVTRKMLPFDDVIMKQTFLIDIVPHLVCLRSGDDVTIGCATLVMPVI